MLDGPGVADYSGMSYSGRLRKQWREKNRSRVNGLIESDWTG